MRVDVTGLTPVEQTALLTLYARALDNRGPRPILGDTIADAVVATIDYDFDGLGVVSPVVCQSALRAKMLDDRAIHFIGAHPDAVVIDLGAGLDDCMRRVNPPSTVDWYSVDLPGVITLRDTVLRADERAHPVPASLADDSWTDAIPADRPTFLRADGLFAFLGEETVIDLFRRIPAYFSSGELAFNDYGRVGPLSRVAVKLARQKMFGDVASLRGYLGFKDAHTPRTWSSRLTLVEEASLAHQPEVDLFPAPLRVMTRICGMVPAAARKARILRYRFEGR